MNTSAIIDTSTAVPTTESVRFIRPIHLTAPRAAKRAEIVDGIGDGSFNDAATH